MKDSGGGFMMGFWIGLLAGAGAALLLAPRPGEETRRELQGRGLELTEQVRAQTGRLSEEAKVRAQQVAGTVRSQVGQVEEKGRIVLSEGMRKAQDAAKSHSGDSDTPPYAA